MKVLLIDDDHGFRATLSLALRRRGCEVVAASNAQESLALAREGGITSILLDMRLGPASGMHLIPELRSLLPTSRLIVLTGYGSIPNAVEAVRLGADDYLLKPASADQILAALQGGEATAPRPSAATVPSLGRLEWEHIQRVLHECGGNVSHTAEALGIDRRTLQRKLAKMPPTE